MNLERQFIKMLTIPVRSVEQLTEPSTATRFGSLMIRRESKDSSAWNAAVMSATMSITLEEPRLKKAGQEQIDVETIGVK